MQIRITRGVEGAREARGDVVIIDVLRAFTTAAYAVAAGIEEIELVGTVEEARARPGFRMGEVGGRLIPGFDHNNSPSTLRGRRLAGRAVQRTSSGTQGVVAAMSAERIWLGSLVTASATARALRGAAEVTLVAMGAPGEPADQEDGAAALYLEALLSGVPPPRERVLEMVRGSLAAAQHSAGDVDRPLEDVACAMHIDAFDFALCVERSNGSLIARRWVTPR